MNYDGRIYSYGISIYGDNFYPQNIIQKIQGDFICNSNHSPNDQRTFRGLKLDGVYGFGSMQC